MWELFLIVAGSIPVLIGVMIKVEAVWSTGMAIWCAGLVVSVVSLVEFRMSRMAASEVLGIKLRFGEPPSRKGKYLAWCERRGIKPFAAEAGHHDSDT